MHLGYVSKYVKIDIYCGMQKELKNLLKLSVAFISILLFFTILRIYFYVSNQSVFLISPNFNLLKAFGYGFIYDIKFVFALNSIIILMFFLPFRFRNTIFWQFIVNLSFSTLNGTAILFYFIDSNFLRIFLITFIW